MGWPIGQRASREAGWRCPLKSLPFHTCEIVGYAMGERMTQDLTAQASIQEHIEVFYNRQRRHSRIGFVPPALFAEEFSKQSQVA